jgi:hypothetical protein
MVDLDYERWKARYRESRNPFDPVPGCDFLFDDAGMYRAFLTREGVDGELLFAFPPTDHEVAELRARELLEISERALAGLALPSRRHYRPTVLEVLHLAPGQPRVSMGWHGAPECAPAASWREFIDRARADLRDRLAADRA